MARLEADEDGFHWYFMCPGCNIGHMFDTRRWQWNGDVDHPTVTPSLLMTRDHANPKLNRCHLFIVNGHLQYLADCTHDLAGQTVPIPDASALWQ